MSHRYAVCQKPPHSDARYDGTIFRKLVTGLYKNPLCASRRIYLWVIPPAFACADRVAESHMSVSESPGGGGGWGVERGGDMIRLSNSLNF